MLGPFYKKARLIETRGESAIKSYSCQSILKNMLVYIGYMLIIIASQSLFLETIFAFLKIKKQNIERIPGRTNSSNFSVIFWVKDTARHLAKEGFFIKN